MLPYQEKILSEILSRVSVVGSRVLEIGGTPPWTVSSRLIELGAKSVTTLNYRADLVDTDVTECIHFRNIDARTMAAKLSDKYDLIFGIAVLEHLPELEVVLTQASRILSSGGTVALHGAAFWSSRLGHHVFVHVDGAKYEFNGNNPIDDFSHLYFSYEQMHDNLVSIKNLPQHHASAICDYIYKNPILNRYYYEDIISAYSRSAYKVTHLRSSAWGPPMNSITKKIYAHMGSYYQDIYRNFGCGELFILAQPSL